MSVLWSNCLESVSRINSLNSLKDKLFVHSDTAPRKSKCDLSQGEGETDVSITLRYSLIFCKSYIAHRLQQMPIFIWQWVVTSFLLIVLAFSLSRLFWLLLDPGVFMVDYRQTATSANVKILEAVASESSTTGTSYVSVKALADIQGLKLFSQISEGVESIKPTLPAVEDKAVDTQLQLLLNGVIASSQQNGARAIIASGNHQALYAPGDVLPISGIADSSAEHVRLVKILPGRVILDNRGIYESLSLYQDEEKTAVRNLNGARQDIAQTQRVDAVPVAETVTNAVQGDITLDRLIKFSMARQAGEVIGYKIRPGRERKLFERLGLQANDIVVAVNGLSLDSSAKAMQVYRGLRGTRSATLDILRGGKPLNLSIDLQQLEG